MGKRESKLSFIWITTGTENDEMRKEDVCLAGDQLQCESGWRK